MKGCSSYDLNIKIVISYIKKERRLTSGITDHEPHDKLGQNLYEKVLVKNIPNDMNGSEKNSPESTTYPQ